MAGEETANSRAGARQARPRAPAWRRGARWLARGLLALVFVLSAAGSLLPQGRAVARAALLLPALLGASQPAPLAASGGPVRHIALTVSSSAGPVYLDVYEPSGPPPPVPGAREGVLILSGVGDNRQVPQLVNLDDALARTGLVAMNLTTTALLGYTLTPGDRAAVVAGFEELLRWPSVGAGRAGMLGFSAGGALESLAAADPRIASQIAFLVLFGSYYDARSLLRDIGRRALDVNGRLVAWQPNPVPLQVLATSLGGSLASVDAETLASAFSPGGQPLSAAQVAALSPPAAAVYHLLAGDQPGQVSANLAALSPAMRAELAALSPSTVVGQIRAPVYLLHDPTDQFVPYTQSEAYAAALARLRHPYEFVLLSIFEHVEVRSGVALGAELRDGAKLARVLDALLLPAS